MSGNRERPGRTASNEAVPPDEQFARAYADGYGEGVRDALKELLQHAARGHTAQELRLLGESRLARVAEEVELKRRSLLSPPRRPSWGPLLRPPSAPTAPETAREAVLPPSMGKGVAILFREEKPHRALEYLRASGGLFPKTILVSMRPPSLPGEDPSAIVVLRPGAIGTDSPGGDPGQVLGEIRSIAEAAGGALVYVDALEHMITEFESDATLRFVNWLGSHVAGLDSGLIVSVDPQVFEGSARGRLQKAFQYAV